MIMANDDGSRGWIGVDLDGTLAEYHGWEGIDKIGAPIPRMLERVKAWMAEGQPIKIVTARVARNPGRDRDVAEGHIRAWLVKHLGPSGAHIPITCKKDFSIITLWDDHCVQVIPNTGLRVDGNP